MSGSPAQEQALVELGRARGLRPDQLVARALTPAELARLQEVARRARFTCPRGCVALVWVDLAPLPALRCPTCGLALACEVTGSGSGPLVTAAVRPTGSFGAVAASGVAEGRTIGTYQVLRELGRGSFGVVYLVKRPGLERQFALKVLLETARDPELLARFRLEGAVASKLEHPGIVGVIDVGQQGDMPYLVMEYCPGVTLRTRVREGGPMAPREAARVILDIARAVAYAHDRGVIHRDLKPANIILEANTGRPKVTDFGLARDRSLARSMTRTGDVIGSPLYAAPEQLRGEKDIDLRVDVYGLGVMLYECLTGQVPFSGTNLVELADSVLRRPLKPVRAIDGRIPAALDEACTRALARDRGERSASAHVLAGELEEWLAAADNPVADRSSPRLTLALALVLAVALVLALVLGDRSSTPPPVVVGTSTTPTEAPPPPAPPPEPVAPPAPPPAPVASELAPAAEVEPLLVAAAQMLVWNDDRRGGLDEEQLALIAGAAPGLLERYPRDSRLVFLTAYVGLIRGEDELQVRRRFVRATWLQPPLGDHPRDAIARLCHTLGFERAAADALEPAFVDARVPTVAACLCLFQVLMKSAPPVQDVDRAIVITRQAIAARAQEPGHGDDLAPTTWNVHGNLAELLLFKGDGPGAAQALEDAARSTRSLQLAEGLRQGAANARELVHPTLAFPRDIPGRNVNFVFGLSRFLGVLVEHMQVGDRGGELEAARSLGGLARSERPERAAIMLVAAARGLERRGDVAGALAALEAAAKLSLPAEAIDVRALVVRRLARLLLLEHPARDVARAEALASEAASLPAGVEALDDPRTPGERADAWVVVGLARRARGDADGVRAAVREAERLSPFDRRELDLLLSR